MGLYKAYIRGDRGNGKENGNYYSILRYNIRVIEYPNDRESNGKENPK